MLTTVTENFRKSIYQINNNNSYFTDGKISYSLLGPIKNSSLKIRSIKFASP